MFLGRYQIGDDVRVRVRIDAIIAPWVQLENAKRFSSRCRATVVQTSGNTVIETVDLSPVDIFYDPRLFEGVIHLRDSDYAVGQYAVLITTTDGTDTLGLDRCFEIAGPGDADGDVQSMVVYEFETGPHAVFETASGDVKIGRRPH